MPLWAVWESAPRPHKDGRVKPAYWKSLSDSASQLRKRADALTLKPECREWQGFIEAYPVRPEARELDPLPDHLLFEEAIDVVVPIQRQVAYLAAWVRMGDALMEFSPRMGNSVEDAICPRANDILMGIWVNGMTEHMVSWMAAAGVPIFVAHEVQGVADSPARDVSSLFVNIPLGGSDLATATILDRWIGLLNDSPGMSVDGPWDSGVDFAAATPRDQLLRWRSFSGATKSNFPGEHWASALPQRIATAPSGHGDPAVESKYVTPPPVQSAAEKGVWSNFVESTDDDGQLVFYLVGKGNKREYEDASSVYYDRAKKRVLHCMGKLTIPATVTHDTSIFGFPCPRTPFYTDRYFRTKMLSSSWLYFDNAPLRRDIGRVAPPPNDERLASIQPIRTRPALIPQEEHSESERRKHESASTQTEPLNGTPPPLVPTTVNPESSSFTPEPSNGQAQISNNNSGVTKSPNLAHESLPIPTAGRTVGNTDVSSRHARTSHRRNFRADPPPHVAVTPSRNLGQLPIREAGFSTPYVLIAGIGHHSLADFRGWMARSLPMLQVTAIRKVRSVVGIAVFVVRFRKREDAVLFLNNYHMRIVGPDRLAISFARHGDYLDIPRSFILEEWNIGFDPCLDPVGSMGTPPTPSLLLRLQVPLENRMLNAPLPVPASTIAGPSSTPVWPEIAEGRRRSRRGGGKRKFAQAILGTPSGK